MVTFIYEQNVLKRKTLGQLGEAEWLDIVLE